MYKAAGGNGSGKIENTTKSAPVKCFGSCWFVFVAEVIFVKIMCIIYYS